MNRLFEALSEMEVLRPAPPSIAASADDAALSAQSEPEAIDSMLAVQEPETDGSVPEFIVSDISLDEMEKLIPEISQEPAQAENLTLPEEIHPTDLDSFIIVVQAEMDRMILEDSDRAVAPATSVDVAPIPAVQQELCPTEIEAAPSISPTAAPDTTVPIRDASIECLLAEIATNPVSDLSVNEPLGAPGPIESEQVTDKKPLSVASFPESSEIAPVPQEEIPQMCSGESLAAEQFPYGMAPLVLVLQPEIQQLDLPFSVDAPDVERFPEPKLVLEPLVEEIVPDFAEPISPAPETISAEAPGASVPEIPWEGGARIEEEKGEPARVIQSDPRKAMPTRPIRVTARVESRLVALTDPNSLGAEKFRALVSRLDHQHKECGLRSFQVTSSVISEGKTLVSGNVAVTLARHLGAKTLLVEGDLHRPTLASIFGLEKMSGLNHWWSGRNHDLSHYVHQIEHMPLWFLPAGKPCERPSDILRSARFVEAFVKLACEFEWIIVDSTPMVPIVDVNLWSRIVDGTLLVAREGVTPVKALKQGLLALDHPNLIGMVLNDATANSDSKYDQYYGTPKGK